MPAARPAGHSSGTAVAPATRSTGSVAPCTPAPSLLTDKQTARLEAVFADDEHVAVEVTWGIYQRMIAAYREPDSAGEEDDAGVIDAVSTGVPAALAEIRTPRPDPEAARRRHPGLLRPPGTSNGPTEAINGRLEHLRGIALGFRNLTNYIARSLLEAGGFRPHLHPRLR